MKEALMRMLYTRSFMYSKEPIYKLASGRQSHFYVNCRPTTLHPEGMFLIGHLVFDVVKDLGIQGVGGLTFGADPVAVATAFASYLKGKPIKAFSIRKEQKGHGIIKWVEGDLEEGERVVIVEDVVTTGGSIIKAIRRARSEGLHVVKAVVLVDRQEGGLEAVRAHVDAIESIITVEELMALHRE